MPALASFLRHALRHPCALLPGTPAGVIDSARRWVDAREARQARNIRRGPQAAYWEVDAPAMRTLPPPKGVREDGLAGTLRMFPVPGTALFFLKGARVAGEAGVVLSPDNRVFAEFTYTDEGEGIEAHSIFRRRRFPALRPLAGWYATLCYPSSFAYFHWVIESLPRLRLLEPYLDALDGVFVPARLEPAMRESLVAMGLREHQLIGVDQGSHYAPEHLLVPQYCAGLDVPPWMPGYLRGRVLGGGRTAGTRRRLYVSRADAGKRRVRNEQAVEQLLRARGFETVRMRELGFLEQARLFNAAEIVVGAHGAGLANVVFCEPGAALLELTPSPAVGPHVYYSLAAANGCDYWYLAGRCAPGQDGPDVHRDFDADTEALALSLDRIEAGLAARGAQPAH